jgi:hypothetical protein
MEPWSNEEVKNDNGKPPKKNEEKKLRTKKKKKKKTDNDLNCSIEEMDAAPIAGRGDPARPTRNVAVGSRELELVFKFNEPRAQLAALGAEVLILPAPAPPLSFVICNDALQRRVALCGAPWHPCGGA